MEIRKILWGVAVTALLAACSSADDAEGDITPSNTGKITVRTALPATPDSRVSFTEQGGSAAGLKVSWQSADELTVVRQGAASATFTAGAISADGHSAEFSGTFEPAATAPVTVGAVASSPAIIVSDAVAVASLAEQAGTLADLSRYDLITGSAQFDPAAGNTINMAMKHQMAFIKGTVTLPFTPDATGWALTLKGDNLTNQVSCSLLDGTLTASAEGDITLSAAPVEGNVLTFYAAVAPGTLKNLRADVADPNGQVYADLLITENFTVEAGKLYTVSRNNETLEDVTLWVNDQAWSKVYDVKNYKISTIERIPAEGTDWLTVTSDGTKVTVSATANTTGAPRQGQIVFGNGSQTTTVDITQIEETDFAGNWDMVAFKLFSTTGSYTTGNHDATWAGAGTMPSDRRTDLRIVDGVDYGNKTELNLVNKTGKTATAYECLTYKQQTATNNILMTGLFENMTTEALSKVDYTNRSATVGIFIDTNANTTKPQRLYTGRYAGEYAALMPELSTKINSGWAFQYATIGGVQYTWYIGKVSVAGHTTAVRWSANTGGMQMLKTSGSTPSLYICGLQVMRYYAPVINATNLIRQKAGGFSANNFAAYAVTYQGDIVMTRTASGYKEVVIGGGSK